MSSVNLGTLAPHRASFSLGKEGVKHGFTHTGGEAVIMNVVFPGRSSSAAPRMGLMPAMSPNGEARLHNL